MIEVPSRIGKYELEKFLGGGMSRVYRARDTHIGGMVALKILTDEAAQDPEAKARFLAEARMARNVAHENVISIYDFGEDEQGRLYMVMEFLHGEDLGQAIRSGNTGNIDTKLNIALQIARALRHIHGLNIIHRDIKPQNIHINPTGLVKLMDFGIAKLEGLAHTRTGYVLGTPYYMAPEQVTGKNISGQADIYAFGILLFELITGSRAITGETVEQVFYDILHEPVNPQPLRQAGTPDTVCNLLLRCTAKDPMARPQGFGAVVAELEHIISERATVTLPMPAVVQTGWRQRLKQWADQARSIFAQRQPWELALAAVLMCIILGGGYLALRPKTAGGPLRFKAATASLPTTLSTPTGDMVLVPAGEFLYGEKQERLSLPAFYIDRTEVTNAAYSRFCRETRHELPQDFPADKPDLPVVNITINDARGFAAWAGKRLPRSEEWEKAARGNDGRQYPWGNDHDPSKANVCHYADCKAAIERGELQLNSVNAFPDGKSPYGVLQMVGNVWEFVDQQAIPTAASLKFYHRLKSPPRREETWYLIRGQSYAETLIKEVIWDSMQAPARWKDYWLGFRCVKDRP